MVFDCLAAVMRTCWPSTPMATCRMTSARTKSRWTTSSLRWRREVRHFLCLLCLILCLICKRAAVACHFTDYNVGRKTFERRHDSRLRPEQILHFCTSELTHENRILLEDWHHEVYSVVLDFACGRFSSSVKQRWQSSSSFRERLPLQTTD